MEHFYKIKTKRKSGKFVKINFAIFIRSILIYETLRVFFLSHVFVIEISG